MRYHYALFDFDGTVADTKEGILKAADYALRHYGITADRESLMRFVGPTLWYSFENFFGFSPEKAEEAVRYYREYYSEKGIYEASLYEYTASTLERLKGAGVKCAIGSSKNEIFVKRALSHFGIDDLFDAVIGSTPSGEHSSKYELIGLLAETLGIEDLSQGVYIGDSKSDYEGARQRGIDFIAAVYDRDPSEFDGCAVTGFARSMPHLGDIILGEES